MLQPLGDRVLIKPDLPRTMTDSGLHLIEHWPQETIGEVVALGTNLSPFQREAHDLARRIDQKRRFCGVCEEIMLDAAQMLRDLTPDPPLAVGDTVLFSAQAGQQITVEGTTVLMLRVSDVLCRVELEEAVTHG